MSLRRLLLPALAAFVATAPAPGQQTIGAWTYDKGATKLTLTGVFDPPPPTGYQPMRIEITNGTADRRSWSLNCRSTAGESRTESTFAIAAEAGKATTTMVLVPLSTGHDVGSYRWSGGYHQLTVGATSPQVGAQTGESGDQRAIEIPALAISDRLAQKSLTQLNDEVRKTTRSGYGNSIFASRFDPSMLPEEWLGYGGFDYVLITDDEWLKLSPGARAAVLQWTRFGGVLHLYRSSDSVTLASLGIHGPGDIAIPAENGTHHGLGALYLRTWNGDTLDAATTVSAYKRGEGLRDHLFTSYSTASKWRLQGELGERSFAGWQVVLFLLCFGILVGPINLFVLAPAGKRHKLFLTTPILAAAASVLLVGLILIQDGTGGKGRRFVAIQIAPEEAKEAVACVTQEQISRAGVLLGSAFELPPSTLCHQVVLEPSPWTKLHNKNNSQGMKTHFGGTRLSGNWFQSRTVQGQFLRSALPTRGRIDLVPPASPGDRPAIVSSLPMDLSAFAYIDETGQEWKAPAAVAPGARTLLEKAPGAAAGLRASLDTASEAVRNQILPFTQRPSTFLAVATAAPGLTVETLDSIRWIDDRIVVFGRLATHP